MKHWIIAGVLVFSAALAQSVPLTRYFPDNALATLELNGIQGAVEQTGQFGEETIRAVTSLAGSSLQSLLEEVSQQLGAGVGLNLGVRAVVGSFRDASVAVYSSSKDSPDFLVVARLGQFGPIGRLAQEAVNDILREPSTRKFREGAYVAGGDSGFWFGMQNGLLFMSTNPDLLRGYLRRVQGGKQPVLSQGAAYRNAMEGVGAGWLRYYLNLSAITQYLNRVQPLPPKAATALRTLNLMAGAQAITSRGVEGRTRTLLNPNGGDAELYKLLTYSPERLELTSQMAAEGVGSLIFATDTVGWLDYARGWLDFFEATFGTNSPGAPQDANQLRDLLSQLQSYLGNEWGLSLPNTSNQFLEAGFWSRLGALSELSDANSLQAALQSLKGATAFATVQDGPATLDAMAEGFAKAKDTTVERLEVAGNPALKVFNQDTQMFVAAKGNLIVLTLDQATLESALSPKDTLANAPDFQAVRFPERPTGLSFVCPIKLDRTQIQTLIADALKATDTPQSSIPQATRQIVVNWLESYYARLGDASGYAQVQGNRLQTFSLQSFRWNK